MFIALFAIAALIACDKEEVVSKEEQKEIVTDARTFVLSDSIKVDVDNGILSFESEESLQECIDYLNFIGNERLLDFEEALGYTSYKTSCNLTDKKYLVEDDLLGTLMNQDRQIIVAGYLLTTNLKDETTEIKPLDDTSLKSSSYRLAEEVTIKWQEDAFDVMQTGERNGYLKGYCKNTPKKKEWKLFPTPNMWGGTNDASRIQAKVCFQRAGWYNSIVIKFKLEKQTDSGYYYNLHYVTVDAKYKRRRRGETKFDREKSCYAKKQGDEISHRPYNGTRRLEWARVPVKFDYKARWRDDESKVVETGEVLLLMKCT